MAEAVRPRKKHRKKTSSKDKSKSKESTKEKDENEIPELQEECLKDEEDSPPVLDLQETQTEDKVDTPIVDLQEDDKSIQIAEDVPYTPTVEHDIIYPPTSIDDTKSDTQAEDEKIEESTTEDTEIVQDVNIEPEKQVAVDSEISSKEESTGEQSFEDAHEEINNEEAQSKNVDEAKDTKADELDIRLPPGDEAEGAHCHGEGSKEMEKDQEQMSEIEAVQDSEYVTPDVEDESSIKQGEMVENDEEQLNIGQDESAISNEITTQEDEEQEHQVLPEDVVGSSEPSAPSAPEAEGTEVETLYNENRVAEETAEIIETNKPELDQVIVSAPPEEFVVEETSHDTEQNDMVSERVDSTIHSEENIENVELPSAPQFSLPAESERTGLVHEERNVVGEESRLIHAFSVKELKAYYQNAMIDYQEDYVEHFVQSCRIEQHDFYALVYNYFKGRNNLQAIQNDIEVLNRDYKLQAEGLWTFVDNHMEVKGMCGDGIGVKEMHQYQTVQFHEEKLKQLERTLKYIRNHVHDTFSLCAYTAQLSRLQIESYLHQLFSRSRVLCELDNAMPVTASMFASEDQNARAEITKLRQCISVLFAFQRRPVTDEEFLNYSRAWLARLVAALLRLSTLEDHVFLLNHILRSPVGIDLWATSFIQISISNDSTTKSNTMPSGWGDSLLDHFVNLLSFFMSPVKYRDEFLIKFKKAITPSSSEPKEGPYNWVLLDEDGEEDEDVDNTLLNENDLVAILQQFPFTQVFKHILHINDSDSTSYDIERVASVDIMRLIAFATFLIGILHQGVQTFNRSRYRQFVKRIGRLIRHTVQHVSDHWLNYRSWRRNTCHDSDDAIPDMEPQRMQLPLGKLQVEFDEFFFRATQCIMSAPRLGTWQFMTDMPYVSLSQLMMWRLLWYLHQKEDETKQDVLSNEAGCEEYKNHLNEKSNKLAFEEKLQEMPMEEVIYLLTSFANMGSARPADETEFIKFIAVEVFELSYVREHTRDFCSKVGRELVSALASTHPFIMSTILHHVSTSIQHVGSMALHLYRELPLFLWRPYPDDMALLRVWLLDHGVASVENQLARLVLLKLNWGCHESNQLVLNIACHRTTAVLVVEALYKHLVEKPPPGMIASGYKKLGYGNAPEQAFHTWAWDMVTKLRLHRQDQPAPVMRSEGASPDDDFGQVPDVAVDTTLYPVQKAVKSEVPIACYVAVAMTKAGHSLEDFITYGIPHLHIIVQSGYPKMATPLIAMVVPMFLEQGHPDYLITNERFLNIVNNILTADHQYSRLPQKLGAQFPGETTRLFTGMVLTQVQNYLAQRTEASASEAVLEFWLKIITSRTGWHLDQDLCYVLDCVIAATFNYPEARRLVVETLLMQYKEIKGEGKSQGLISTMLSFVSYGSSLPSLMDKPSSTTPWLAYGILSAETQYLEELNLLRAVSSEMADDPDMNPDAALKRACSKLHLQFNIPLYRLPVYRWAQQALDTPMDHPLLPVLWQQFFTQFLHRCFSSGNVQRFGVGERYFKSMTNNSFRKKLKTRLHDTADFHHNASNKVPASKSSSSLAASTPQSETAPTSHDASGDGEAGSAAGVSEVDTVFEGEPEMHQKLVKLYQIYKLWLEETLLHDPSLYLPSLPEQYDAESLAKIFNGDQDLWMAFIDLDRVNHNLSLLVKEWLALVKPTNTGSVALVQPLTSEQQLLGTATSRILDRLSRHEKPKPAPDIVELRAPVPDVPGELLVNNHAMVAFLQDDVMELVNYANSFANRETKNVVLDCDYLELMPDLYLNMEVQNQLRIPCKSTFNPMHQCSRPAHVTITHKQKATRDNNLRKLEVNRMEYKQLTIESQAPPPAKVCVAAVHIENAITDLINLSRATSDVELAACRQTGVTLFFHLGQQMDEASRHYPPTRQFFSSCIEILGQEYIRPFPEQAQTVLEEILGNSNMAGLLAPNLAPNLCGDGFVAMYDQVCHAPQNGNQDIMFMLLTKFDPSQWLAHNEPSIALRSQLVQIIGNTIINYGPKVDESRHQMQFEVLRGHLQSMFNHRFPDHCADVIKILLQGSEQGQLNPDIWSDVLKSLNVPVLTFGKASVDPDKVQQLIQPNPRLSLQQIHETSEWLGNHFRRLRHSDAHSSQFGLFSKWKPYIQPLASFLGYLALNCVVLEAQRVHSVGLDALQAIQSLWSEICGLFSPWIIPIDIQSPTNPNLKQQLPPWVEGDGIQGCSIMCIFTQAVGCLQTQFQDMLPPSTKNAMSNLWPFYYHTLASRSLREDVLQIYHKCLVDAPWNQYQPDLEAMDLMVKIYEEKHSSCLLFLGRFFPNIDWRHLVTIYSDNFNPEAMNKFLSSLLSLLIIFANEEVVLSLEGGMVHLMSDAANFPWHHLDSSSYNAAAHWQLERSNPRHAFGLDNSKMDNSISSPRLTDTKQIHTHIALRLITAYYLMRVKLYKNNAPRAEVGVVRAHQEVKLSELDNYHFSTSLMRSAGGLTNGSTIELTPSGEIKRRSYMDLVVGMLCKCSQLTDVRSEQFIAPIQSLLNDIDMIATAGGSQDQRIPELHTLLNCILSLLNNCSPIGGAPDAIVKGIMGWLEMTSSSALSLPCITSSCRTVASVKYMAQLVEASIESHFNSDADLTAGTSHGWAVLNSTLNVPEITHDEFLMESFKQGAYLTLFVYLGQRLPSCQTLEEESALYTKLMDWCIQCKPKLENEPKVFLWWWRVLELTLRMIDFGTPGWTLSRSLNNLVPAMSALGEDRSSSGLLGVIGLGRHSQLSHQFRLIARCMASFISAQVLRNGHIRLKPLEVGAVSDAHSYPSSPSSPDAPRPTSHALQTLKILEATIENKNYVALKEHTLLAKSFVLNSEKSLRNAQELLGKLVSALFPDQQYLLLIRNV